MLALKFLLSCSTSWPAPRNQTWHCKASGVRARATEARLSLLLQPVVCSLSFPLPAACVFKLQLRPPLVASPISAFCIPKWLGFDSKGRCRKSVKPSQITCVHGKVADLAHQTRCALPVLDWYKPFSFLESRLSSFITQESRPKPSLPKRKAPLITK